jgi:hypothetical protein
VEVRICAISVLAKDSCCFWTEHKSSRAAVLSTLADRLTAVLPIVFLITLDFLALKLCCKRLQHKALWGHECSALLHWIATCVSVHVLTAPTFAENLAVVRLGHEARGAVKGATSILLSTACEHICVSAVLIIAPNVCSIMLEAIALRTLEHRAASFLSCTCVPVLSVGACGILACKICGIVPEDVVYLRNVGVACSNWIAARVSVDIGASPIGTKNVVR